jgi:hypothetical protein
LIRGAFALGVEDGSDEELSERSSVGRTWERRLRRLASLSCVHPPNRKPRQSVLVRCDSLKGIWCSRHYTYRLNILSPILLPDSRVMVSPSDSNLSLSLLADRRCEVLVSAVGVPSFDAPCTLTTGMGVSRFASESELEPIADVRCRCRLPLVLYRRHRTSTLFYGCHNRFVRRPARIPD